MADSRRSRPACFGGS